MPCIRVRSPQPQQTRHNFEEVTPPFRIPGRRSGHPGKPPTTPRTQKTLFGEFLKDAPYREAEKVHTQPNLPPGEPGLPGKRRG